MFDTNLFEEISQYPNWTTIRPIEKGWSGEKKYYIIDKSNQQFLLRIADIDQYSAKQKIFHYLQKLAEFDTQIPIPRDFGTLKGNKYVYALYSWVEGEDAEEHIGRYSPLKQYLLGRKAGHHLNHIHSIPAPPEQEPWTTRFRRKIQNRIKQYQQCPLKIDQGEVMIAFLEEHQEWLDDRPQTFHHGDFHLGNIIITPDNDVGVIDFNRYDFGDPWEEFNRIVFSWNESIPFVLGQIHSYFKDKVPSHFFDLLALYIANNTISSIPWAIPYGENEINFMQNNAQEVLNVFDYFTTTIPKWYKSPNAMKNLINTS